MIKKTKPNVLDVMAHIKIFPHCDPRILHAPGECEVCDKHSDWQALRQIWGITFTGYEPEGKELPDPATHARGYENANAWSGNKAKPSCDVVEVPDHWKVNVHPVHPSDR